MIHWYRMIHEKNLPEVLFHSYFLKSFWSIWEVVSGKWKGSQNRTWRWSMLFPKRRLFVVNSQPESTSDDSEMMWNARPEHTKTFRLWGRRNQQEIKQQQSCKDTKGKSWQSHCAQGVGCSFVGGRAWESCWEGVPFPGYMCTYIHRYMRTIETNKQLYIHILIYWWNEININMMSMIPVLVHLLDPLWLWRCAWPSMPADWVLCYGHHEIDCRCVLWFHSWFILFGLYDLNANVVFSYRWILPYIFRII